jgi:glucose-1-phosphate cytidylyltransferase
MRAIILAGGLGTRLSEETADKPKPMVEIAGRPMLWHIMNIFALQGITQFVVATGYKGEVIHDWINTIHEEWEINVVDTGLDTQTGGRIAECMKGISDEKTLATYGDGLANVDISKLLRFHDSSQTLATVTAVRPPARFGVLHSQNGVVTHFGEKSQADSGWINGGFFVLNRKVRDYIQSLEEPFETGAIPRLVNLGQLSAFHHSGFWQPMDTLRERNELDALARQHTPPWLEGLIQ